MHFPLERARPERGQLRSGSDTVLSPARVVADPGRLRQSGERSSMSLDSSGGPSRSKPPLAAAKACAGSNNIHATQHESSSATVCQIAHTALSIALPDRMQEHRGGRGGLRNFPSCVQA